MTALVEHYRNLGVVTEESAVLADIEALSGETLPILDDIVTEEIMWYPRGESRIRKHHYGIVVADGHVVKLSLYDHKSIDELPPSIGQLKQLQELDLMDCEYLTKLPESVGELLALVKIDLAWCRSLLQLPESLGKLINLQELDLSYCKALTTLPVPMAQMERLEKLDLGGCEAMASLPSWIGSLPQLKSFRYINNRMRELPDWFESSKLLEELEFSSCESLLRLPEWIGQLMRLRKLSLTGCTAISTLPSSIGKLNQLQQLDLAYCTSLSALPDSIGDLTHLETLNLYHCDALEALPETIGRLGNLQDLAPAYCVKLTALPGSIGGLASLRILNLMGSESLGSLPESLGELKRLKELDLSSCSAISALPGSIGRLEKLEKLFLGWCERLSSLPDTFKDLTSLKSLIMTNTGLKKIPPVLRFMPSFLEISLENNAFSEEERVISRDSMSVIQDYLRKKADITIFLSHAIIDFERLRLGELITFLENHDEVYQVDHCENSLAGNIDDFMLNHVLNSQLVLFIASQKATFHSEQGCAVEIKAARDAGIPIIPLIAPDMTWSQFEESPVGQIIGRELGVNIDMADYPKFCNALYEYIKKYKRTINLFDKQKREVDRLGLRVISILTDFLGKPSAKEIIARRYADLKAVLDQLSASDDTINVQIGKKIISLLDDGFKESS